MTATAAGQQIVFLTHEAEETQHSSKGTAGGRPEANTRPSTGARLLFTASDDGAEAGAIAPVPPGVAAGGMAGAKLRFCARLGSETSIPCTYAAKETVQAIKQALLCLRTAVLCVATSTSTWPSRCIVHRKARCHWPRHYGMDHLLSTQGETLDPCTCPPSLPLSPGLLLCGGQFVLCSTPATVHHCLFVASLDV
jgi:hypothetical protein